MQVVADSRVIKNFIRDIVEDRKSIEDHISFLNATNSDVDIYDYTSKKFIIIYPGTIGKIARPQNQIFIGINNTILVDAFSEDDYSEKIILARKDLLKRFMIIEGPTKYNPSKKSYVNNLSLRWVEKQKKYTDKIILTSKNPYVIYVPNIQKSNNFALIFIIIAVIIFAIIIFLAVKYERRNNK
jgi:hypothetical protein